MSNEIENLTCDGCGRNVPLVDAWASLVHTCDRLSCLGPRWIAVLIGNVVMAGALHAAYSRGGHARQDGDPRQAVPHRAGAEAQAGATDEETAPLTSGSGSSAARCADSGPQRRPVI